MDHEIYMKRCIQLAKLAEGDTYPNPMVGSVIVYDGKIIGEGYHQKAGEPHAEINAINSVRDQHLLEKSTIYVSLEPCAHFGKTPPCALRLAEIGFEKVVIGASDPHDKVAGKGVQILQDAGIEVILGVLQHECELLNKRFFTFHRKKRPYIILKWAESQDHFMDYNFKPTKISNNLASQFVHKMRSDEHAIMVGTHTALNDNPTLSTRNIKGRNPVRILIDFDQKVPLNSNIFNCEAPTVIFTNKINDRTYPDSVKVISCERRDFLQKMLTALHKLEIQSVLVEGGSYTLQKFIDSGLWDEAYIIQNPELFLNIGTLAPAIPDQGYSDLCMKGNRIRHLINRKNF